MQVGKVGAYSMYVRQGAQIVRQRQNASNYGEEARRTLAQQSRRVQWSNLVNFYRACKYWMPKAFESRQSNQTDYNAFVSANINASQVTLDKSEAEKGCCVADEYIISRGSLPSVGLTTDAQLKRIYTDIKMSSAYSGSKTIGQVTTEILNNNPSYQDGDNLGFVIIINSLVDDLPYCSSMYYEFTLDSEATSAMSTLPVAAILATSANNTMLGLSDDWLDTLPDYDVAWACIHTRGKGKLQVSSQQLIMLDSHILEEYTTSEQRAKAINSYGLDNEVPLMPGGSVQ